MKIVLFAIIFLLNYLYISNDGCDYYEKVGESKVTNPDYLNEFHTEEEKKQKCFSLSNFDGSNPRCCYNSNSGCIKEGTNGETTVECPEHSIIYNNCGMAGIYEPVFSTICTEISLVQGYCCFVETNKGKACIRTKKLHKDVNATTDQIDTYVKSIANDGEVKKVICKGWNLKIYNLLIVLITLMLI